MHEYCQLAYQSIKNYLEKDEVMQIPSDVSKDLIKRKAGVFVSLHLKSDHSLRGCIGTFLPTRKNLAEEIIYNAIFVAVDDPRFISLQLAELDDLEINVDVLSFPKKCEIKDLDPKKYGVIVSSGFKRGLLLPDLEGIDEVSQQLKIACQKAGIDYNNGKGFQVERFTVERFK